jgi:hypothetical protein
MCETTSELLGYELCFICQQPASPPSPPSSYVPPPFPPSSWNTQAHPAHRHTRSYTHTERERLPFSLPLSRGAPCYHPLTRAPVVFSLSRAWTTVVVRGRPRRRLWTRTHNPALLLLLLVVVVMMAGVAGVPVHQFPKRQLAPLLRLPVVRRPMPALGPKTTVPHPAPPAPPLPLATRQRRRRRRLSTLLLKSKVPHPSPPAPTLPLARRQRQGHRRRWRGPSLPQRARKRRRRKARPLLRPRRRRRLRLCLPILPTVPAARPPAPPHPLARRRRQRHR